MLPHLQQMMYVSRPFHHKSTCLYGCRVEVSARHAPSPPSPLIANVARMWCECVLPPVTRLSPADATPLQLILHAARTIRPQGVLPWSSTLQHAHIPRSKRNVYTRHCRHEAWEKAFAQHAAPPPVPLMRRKLLQLPLPLIAHAPCMRCELLLRARAFHRSSSLRHIARRRCALLRTEKADGWFARTRCLLTLR